MANKELTSITAGGETYDITDSKAIKAPKICYATCATAAGTAAKVVTTSTNSGFKLEVGAVVAIKFSNSNTASSVTLNVDNTGAKSIYYNNAVYTANSNGICGYKNRVVLYMYDGTYWVWIGYSNDNNTTYSNRAAEEGGTATSLCTTGEKFIWNNKVNFVEGSAAAIPTPEQPFYPSGEYSDLDTNDKSLIGAINEVMQKMPITYSFPVINVEVSTKWSPDIYYATVEWNISSNILQKMVGVQVTYNANGESSAWCGVDNVDKQNNKIKIMFMRATTGKINGIVYITFFFQ